MGKWESESGGIMNTLQISALTWLMQGYAVLPIRWRNKTPNAQKLPGGSWEYLQRELPTEADVTRWFASRLENIGLVMGWNGLVVVDFDNMDAYNVWRQVEQIATYEVKTARGMHVYFQIKEPISNMHSNLLDIKAHGYVLIPPSIHPSGFEYMQHNANPIKKVEKLSDVLPEALIPAPVEPVPTEFIPQQPAITGNLLDQLDTPIDPDVDIVKQVRERVSILSMVSGATPTSRGGRWYAALCPFHDDHHPSFWIDAQRGLCGCRNCKMMPMDVINLYARLHGVSNQEAIFYLAKGI
jgi:hypothetical protein